MLFKYNIKTLVLVVDSSAVVMVPTWKLLQKEFRFSGMFSSCALCVLYKLVTVFYQKGSCQDNIQISSAVEARLASTYQQHATQWPCCAPQVKSPWRVLTRLSAIEFYFCFYEKHKNHHTYTITYISIYICVYGCIYFMYILLFEHTTENMFLFHQAFRSNFVNIYVIPLCCSPFLMLMWKTGLETQF